MEGIMTITIMWMAGLIIMIILTIYLIFIKRTIGAVISAMIWLSLLLSFSQTIYVQKRMTSYDERIMTITEKILDKYVDLETSVKNMEKKQNTDNQNKK